MKKCAYCGKKYPDEAAFCLMDGEPLPTSEAQSSPIPEIAGPAASGPLPPDRLAILPAASRWTERQLMAIETVLVCSVAFGGSILASVFVLFGHSLGQSHQETHQWTYGLITEAAMLGLVWYLLLRTGRSFSDWGSRLRLKDIGMSILLSIAGILAYYILYCLLYYSGWTGVTYRAAHDTVTNYLFNKAYIATTFLFACLNPFFEELIVRAYLITQVRNVTGSATKAVIISAVFQAGYHLYQGVPMAFASCGIFLIWSIYFVKTNRIAPIILAHLYFDLGTVLLYMRR